MDLNAILTALDNATLVAAPYVLVSFFGIGVLMLIWRIRAPLLAPVPVKVSDEKEETVES